MTADEFYEYIVDAGNKVKKLDYDTLPPIVKHHLIGVGISLKDTEKIFTDNEIQNLISNYRMPGISYLLSGITLYEKVIPHDDNLNAFGNMDAFLCYDNEQLITWREEVFLELWGVIAKDPESFLDALAALAYNNLFQEVSREELLHKLVSLSGTRDSEKFYMYLLDLLV